MYVPPGLLATNREVFEGKRSRPVPDDGAHRAGINIHGGCSLLRECVRSDAAASLDRAALRSASRHPAIFDGVADTARNEYPAGDGELQGLDRTVRRCALRACEL